MKKVVVMKGMLEDRRLQIHNLVFSKESPKLLRILCVWLIITATVMTIYQSIDLCVDFFTEKTVTKVYLDYDDDGSINITLCIRTSHVEDPNVDPTDAYYMGFFEPLLTYTATHLTWINISKSDNTPFSIQEFKELARTPMPAPINNLVEGLYKFLATKLDSKIVPSVMENKYDLRMLSRKVTDTRKYPTTYPEFLCISGPMQHRLEGFDRTDFLLPFRLLRRPFNCNSSGFGDTFFLNHYSNLALFDVNDYLQNYIPNAFEDICSAPPTIFYISSSYTLKADKHIQPNLWRKRCIDSEDWVVPAGLGRKLCRTECANRRLQTRFGCKFAMSEPSNDKLQLTFCHWYNLLDNLRSDLYKECIDDITREICKPKPVIEWSLLIVKRYYDELYSHIFDKCAEQCKTYQFCTEWEIIHRQTYEETGSYIGKLYGGPQSNLTGITEHTAQGTVNVAKPNFITVYETSELLSWADFIANLGGVIGFYFGLSVLSVFEACVVAALYFWQLKQRHIEIKNLENKLPKNEHRASTCDVAIAIM